MERLETISQFFPTRKRSGKHFETKTMESTSSNVSVSLCKNGNMKDGRVVVLKKGDWNQLLKSASNKFRMKAKRVFTTTGQEITQQDYENTTEIVQVDQKGN